MTPLARDTSTEAQQLIFRMLSDAPASKKLLLTFDLIQSARLLVLSGLRRRFPNATDSELHRLLVAKLLPREDVIRAYGFDPETREQ